MPSSLEHVLHLFHSIWFQDRSFVTQYCNSNQQKGQHNFSSQEQEEHENSRPESANTLNIRSHSDRFLMPLSSDSHSPTSVMPSPKLQTVFSGKEVAAGFEKPNSKQDLFIVRAYAGMKPDKRMNLNRQRKLVGRNRKGSLKSLTDLEFEELKGFKDLGFEFSEDCDDADLVSIVPGLQRLRRRSDSLDVEKPYLSEAWGVMEKKEALLNPATLIINHKFRQVDMENELAMKEQIKCWAHYVATAIR